MLSDWGESRPTDYDAKSVAGAQIPENLSGRDLAKWLEQMEIDNLLNNAYNQYIVNRIPEASKNDESPIDIELEFVKQREAMQELVAQLGLGIVKPDEYEYVGIQEVGALLKQTNYNISEVLDIVLLSREDEE